MKTIWYKDPNLRVYRRDENGKVYGAPIERERWRELQVITETSRSWVLSNGGKVPKNTVFPNGNYAATVEQVNDIAWFDENLHKIADTVQRLGFGIERYKNIEKLREVAKIVGYEEK